MSGTRLFIKRIRTRSFRNGFQRCQSIFKRYGFSSENYIHRLEQFIDLARRYQFNPTFPITATVLKNHASYIQSFQDLGVEFAIHGYRHIDYTNTSPERVSGHIQKARTIFENFRIDFSGFRFPYLRRDEERIQQLMNSGFTWDSSEVVSWDCIERDLFDCRIWDNYLKILGTYQAKEACEARSLPFMKENLVEIPVSIPDDDMLIERLGIRDQELLFHIWSQMFFDIRKRNELLVLQLHPERFPLFSSALEKLITLIVSHGNVWIASLGAIAAWWTDKRSFQFNITKMSSGKYLARTQCSERANIIPMHGIVPKGDAWEIQSEKAPLVGIHPDTHPSVQDFIRSEGYAANIDENNGDYAIYFKIENEFDKNVERKVLSKFKASRFPLMQYARWPFQFECAVAITGDIDGINLWDFVERFSGKE